ncbi:hypothetical protein [Streptomyces griseoruber]|uniref:hypothetical protein n=1 Tax=Streptomyces griseoruber TaxID=1943 RepID=UPI0037A51C3B
MSDTGPRLPHVPHPVVLADDRLRAATAHLHRRARAHRVRVGCRATALGLGTGTGGSRPSWPGGAWGGSSGRASAPAPACGREAGRIRSSAARPGCPPGPPRRRSPAGTTRREALPRGFPTGPVRYLRPGGEGRPILSGLAGHLGPRTRAELLAHLETAGPRVRDRLDTHPRHRRARDTSDPLHAARAAECISLWRPSPDPQVERQPPHGPE